MDLSLGGGNDCSSYCSTQKVQKSFNFNLKKFKQANPALVGGNFCSLNLFCSQFFNLMLIASRPQKDADLKKLGADLRAGLQQMIDNILKAEMVSQGPDVGLGVGLGYAAKVLRMCWK